MTAAGIAPGGSEAPRLVDSGRAANGEVELAWERWGAGSGDPLLLVSGLGSPMVGWEIGLIGLLAASGWDVVRFDNRDAGRSTSCEGIAYDLGDMARDAGAVIDAVGWETAVAFGQSMGGMIAQTMAIETPERLTGVVSLMSNTGNPDVGGPRPDVVEAMMSVPPPDREGWIVHRLATEKLWGSHPIVDGDWPQRKAELLYDYGMNPEGTDRQWWAVIRSGNREEALGGVELPFLVLHGSVDTLLPPEGGRRTAELVPGARYVEIEGLGHDLAPDHWDRLVSEVSTMASA